MNIVTKIWLGFTLLITGYVMTMIITELSSQRGERFLVMIETSAFPCANAAQSALADFKQQQAFFQDAVVFGEPASVERAISLQLELTKHLTQIENDLAASSTIKHSAAALNRQIQAFNNEAFVLYPRLAKGDNAPELPALAASMKARSDHLANELDHLRDSLRHDLKTAISDRAHQNGRDRLISEVVFTTVLALAVGLIAAVILNLSSRLRQLISASSRLTSGDYLTAVTDAAQDEVGQLGQGFEAMRVAIHKRNQELQTFNASLDGLVRERTRELEQRNDELSTQIAERQRAERSLRLVESAIVQIDEGVVIAPADTVPTGIPEYLNPGFFKTLHLAPGTPITGGLVSLFGLDPVPDSFRAAWETACSGTQQTVEVTLTRSDGSDGIIEWHVAPLRDPDGRVSSVVSILRDLTEQKRDEVQRHQGQKMESIGQLAAGVAHEINTPIQFIGDNLRFLGDSFGDLTTVLGAHAKLLEAARADSGLMEAIAATDAASKRADVAYLTEEIPKALAQSLEGVTRVAEIVRAMKEFSHPDQGEMKPTDLNKAITTTLTVARNEYKYVAELVTDFDPGLPPVPCIVGEFNQVVLNLIVNAAHAIGDVIATTGGLGTLTLSTRLNGDHVEVRIRDTGTGIPESARAKIFDPFFTTKPVGKGTGQGLSIAHTVITKKHGGTLTFETELGKGTTFIIKLPLTSTVRQKRKNSSAATGHRSGYHPSMGR